jgi:hypothetical protein
MLSCPSRRNIRMCVEHIPTSVVMPRKVWVV